MIYFVECETSPLIKVGYTSSARSHRLGQMQIGCPFRLSYVATFDGGRDVERLVHCALLAHKVIGEWFEGAAVRQFLADVQATSFAIALGDWSQAAAEYSRQHREMVRQRTNEALAEVAGALDELIESFGDKEDAAEAVGTRPHRLTLKRLEPHALMNIMVALPHRGAIIERKLRRSINLPKPGASK